MEIKKASKQNKIKVMIAIIIAIISIIISRDNYTAHLMCSMGIYAIAVSGLDILFGHSGQISFGHAAFYMIGAYTTAIFSTKFGISPFLGIIMGAIFASIIGAILAFPASNLAAHFLSFLTIAFGNIVYGIVVNIEFLGRYDGIRNVPLISFFGYKLDSRPKYIIFIGVAMIIMLALKHHILNSRTGRAFHALRDNPLAADGSGINVKKYKILAFAVSAFYTGIAGGLFAHMNNYLSPDTFTRTTSVLFMTMLIVGGMGTFFGPIIGAIVFTLVYGWLQAFSIYQNLVYAIFILMVLFFMPDGLQGLSMNLVSVIRKRFKKNKNKANKEVDPVA